MIFYYRDHGYSDQIGDELERNEIKVFETGAHRHT